MSEFHVVDATQLAEAYAAAEYSVVLDGDVLPLRVGAPANWLEDAWPAHSYALVTAWNPASMPRTDAENATADARLCGRLDAAGIARRPARAEDRDGRWREPGWLVADAEMPWLDALSREFGQAGVLAWDRGTPVRLRMLLPRPRLRTGSGSAFIDWVE